MCTLLDTKWITNKDLLYSTGNSAQCYVAAWMGGEFGREGIRVQRGSTWNYNNTVHQLYSSIKQKAKKIKRASMMGKKKVFEFHSSKDAQEELRRSWRGDSTSAEHIKVSKWTMRLSSSCDTCVPQKDTLNSESPGTCERGFGNRVYAEERSCDEVLLDYGRFLMQGLVSL